MKQFTVDGYRRFFVIWMRSLVDEKLEIDEITIFSRIMQRMCAKQISRFPRNEKQTVLKWPDKKTPFFIKFNQIIQSAGAFLLITMIQNWSFMLLELYWRTICAQNNFSFILNHQQPLEKYRARHIAHWQSLTFTPKSVLIAIFFINNFISIWPRILHTQSGQNLIVNFLILLNYFALHSSYFLSML